MKTIPFLFLFVPILCLCGCADKLTPPDDLQIVLADGTRIYRMDSEPPMQLQLERSDGVEISAGNAAEGAAKAYPISRYIDPNNPSIMHERHVIYRREGSNNWLLDAAGSQQILIGPTVGKTPVNLHPVVVGAEMAIELQKQRELSSMMIKGTEDLGSRTQDLMAALQKSDGQKAKLADELRSETEKRKNAELREKQAADELTKLKAPRRYTGDDDE